MTSLPATSLAQDAPFVTGDMDVGGTFTDGFFTCGDRVAAVKVDTTPHDLTVCFWQCLAEGAASLGFDGVEEMLARTRVIRFATTVATNAILEGTGAKLGLMVTRGEEERLYSSSSARSPLLGTLVPEELVIGVVEPARTGEAALDQTIICAAVNSLLENGARQVVLVLRDDGRTGASERAVREVVRHHYPAHYLGSVPLVLSSEVRPRIDDFTRANIAVINAYLSPGLRKALYRADDRLRAAGYPNPLLITHANGGAARVAKSLAIDTYNSGPSAGLFGCARFAAAYGVNHAVTVDIGGTSTDLGILRDGAPLYDFESSIAGIPVGLPLYRVRSIGGGGGSIARAGPDGTVSVGPRSAGSVPGPACYGLGGSEPTVTDAAVVLGYLDPERFLGGRRKLDPDAARRAIFDALAGPLGQSIEEVALKILRYVGSSISAVIRELIGGGAEAETPDRLFVFGGAGGLFAAQLSSELKTAAVLFRHGSILNAFGSSGMDVVHLYEQPIGEPAVPSLKATLVDVASRLEVRARRDMRAEGFPNVEHLEVELEIRDPERGDVSVSSAPRGDSWEASFEHLLQGSPGAEVSLVRIRARAPVPHPELARFEEAEAVPSKALRGSRTITFERGSIEASVYSGTALRPDNRVTGPALVEGLDTTVIVPPGYEMVIDRFLNAVLQPTSAREGIAQ